MAMAFRNEYQAWMQRERIAVYGLFAAVHDLFEAKTLEGQAECIIRMKRVHGEIQELRNEATLRAIGTGKTEEIS